MIDAAPVPTHVDLQITDAKNQDGGTCKLVAFIVTTPTGAHVTYWDPDATDALGKALRDKAREAKTGISVVTNRKIVTAASFPKVK